jgi:hypothetical protein
MNQLLFRLIGDGDLEFVGRQLSTSSRSSTLTNVNYKFFMVFIQKNTSIIPDVLLIWGWVDLNAAANARLGLL